MFLAERSLPFHRGLILQRIGPARTLGPHTDGGFTRASDLEPLQKKAPKGNTLPQPWTKKSLKVFL